MGNIRSRVLPRGWYPTSANNCRERIQDFVSGFRIPVRDWVGGVVPHAGWEFSGKAAARVFATLAKAMKPDRIVLYGGHLAGTGKPIIYTENHWETPLGLISMDSASVSELVQEGLVVPAPASYSDNTVEVILPFVKYFFPDASLIAVHSPASEKAVDLGKRLAEFLAARNVRTLYVGSADLTHYGPNYGFVPMGTGPTALNWVKEYNDKSLIDKALAMDAFGVLHDARSKQNTCSPGPVASVIASTSVRGAVTGTLLEYYTSYDIAPGSSFVGYASIVY